MGKRFSEWIGLKESLDERNIQAPHVNEGDIWWVSLGENVGWEINGKSREFSRPVIKNFPHLMKDGVAGNPEYELILSEIIFLIKSVTSGNFRITVVMY